MSVVLAMRIVMTVLIVLATNSVVLSQNPPTENLIYVHNGQEFGFVNYATGYKTVVPSDYCRRLSPQGDTVALYPLINPSNIVFLDTSDGSVLRSILWDSAWSSIITTCAKNYWLNNSQLVVQTSETTAVAINWVDGSVVEALPQSLPVLFDVVNDEWSSGFNVGPTSSPSGRYWYYNRYVDASTGSYNPVIYDSVLNGVLVELTDQAFRVFRARPIGGEIYVNWSYDEHYVDILTNEGLFIFDLITSEFLTLNTPVGFGSLERGASSWSPDNTQLAFTVTNAQIIGQTFDEGIVIVDLESGQVNAIPLAAEFFPGFNYQFAWLPSINGFLSATLNGDLYEIAADGTVTWVSDNVRRIYAWYEPNIEPTLTPTPTLTPSPTSTPTPALNTVTISPTPANPLILSEETRAWYTYTITLSATLTGSDSVTVRLDYYPPTPTNYAHIQTRPKRPAGQEVAWTTAQTLTFNSGHLEYEVRIRAR